MIEPKTSLFEKYFTLEEAAGMLPQVEAELMAARQKIAELRDGVILKKRIMTRQKIEGNTPDELDNEVLRGKIKAYEEAIRECIEHFSSQGILLRDLGRGLIDFPYRSRKTGKEYLLCWHLGEDGLFYFHDMAEGFPGRKPITLLPD